jgi:4-hydroxy-2-oxoheptanedioate aldolase
LAFQACLGREHGALRVDLAVDLQHGLVDYTDAVPGGGGDSQTDTTPMRARNHARHHHEAVDGAYGIVCLMINTPAECEEFIQNCR